MEISEAMRIIKAAADGVNPFTGEMFPGDSVYQHPQMVRALYRALAALEARQRWEDKKRQLPENAGKPWTAEDDRRLISEFDSGIGIQELAGRFKRTYGSIEARLINMGKIQPPPGQPDKP